MYYYVYAREKRIGQVAQWGWLVFVQNAEPQKMRKKLLTNHLQGSIM
nr:MAG TPA: hypothetical protein [Caudoviricetes sp.]